MGGATTGLQTILNRIQEAIDTHTDTPADSHSTCTTTAWKTTHHDEAGSPDLSWPDTAW